MCECSFVAFYLTFTFIGHFFIVYFINCKHMDTDGFRCARVCWNHLTVLITIISQSSYRSLDFLLLLSVRLCAYQLFIFTLNVISEWKELRNNKWMCVFVFRSLSLSPSFSFPFSFWSHDAVFCMCGYHGKSKNHRNILQ